MTEKKEKQERQGKQERQERKTIPRQKHIRKAINAGLYTPAEIHRYLIHKGKEYKIKTIEKDLEWDYPCTKMVLSGNPIPIHAELNVIASIISDILAEIDSMQSRQAERKARPYMSQTETKLLETLKDDPKYESILDTIDKAMQYKGLTEKLNCAVTDFDRILELSKRLDFLILKYGPKINFDKQKQQDK
ncbi:MAG: hypothetical protein OXC46_10550 [Thaumarchaeota archaeon]|nr:hypothetical protein [Nitrososphaerota archaeon]